MPIPVAILAALKSKTFVKYGIILAIVAAVLLGTYFKGRHDVQVKWDLEKVTVAAKIKELESRGEKVTIVKQTEIVEVIKEIKVKGDTITKLVYLYLPGEVGPPMQPESGPQVVYRLPKNFIALHDFAALGVLPAATDPTIADISISEEQLQKVLGVITDNYKTCHAIEAQRDGWQSWYREQAAVHNEVTGRK